ncbi:MAG: hypothetical protein WCG05_05525 [Alphaproteobacteria bacterium]
MTRKFFKEANRLLGFRLYQLCKSTQVYATNTPPQHLSLLHEFCQFVAEMLHGMSHR